MEGYEFDNLEKESETTRIKCLSKSDLSNVLEENKEDTEEHLTNGDTEGEYSFGFSGGYSMKTANKELNDHSPFIRGCLMALISESTFILINLII